MAAHLDLEGFESHHLALGHLPDIKNCGGQGNGTVDFYTELARSWF